MKYLPLYYKWLEDGKIPAKGLCTALDADPMGFFYKFDDCFQLMFDSVPWNLTGEYWGQDDPGLLRDRGKFTTLRQNIILICAALNGEL